MATPLPLARSPTDAARELGIPPELCVRCKGGKLLCGLPRCPILERVRELMPAPVALRGREFSGPSPPSLFVGRFGYPAVRAGPMFVPSPAAGSEPALMDSPRAWTDWTLESIFAMRASLLRGRRLVDVHAPRDSVVEAAQLLAQASKPATVEVTLEKDPPRDLRAALEGFAAPLGPGVDARAARVVENPVIPRKVDALVNDLDAPAGTAATELYDGGIDAYHIQRLLSAGVLGVGRRRRLVPTRWSITATDDILGKELIARAKRLPEVGGIRHHAAELFGNRFHVLLLPRAWSFEMLESWQRGAMWASGEVLVQDWEPWEGRSDYADNITGAYYAARLGVLEHLLRTRRQASVVVYREITPAYYMELGVWVIREGVRKALDAPAHRPVSVAAALAEVGKGVGLQDWHRKSVLLDRFLRQRRITDFQG